METGENFGSLNAIGDDLIMTIKNIFKIVTAKIEYIADEYILKGKKIEIESDESLTTSKEFVIKSDKLYIGSEDTDLLQLLLDILETIDGDTAEIKEKIEAMMIG